MEHYLIDRKFTFILITLSWSDGEFNETEKYGIINNLFDMAVDWEEDVEQIFDEVFLDYTNAMAQSNQINDALNFATEIASTENKDVLNSLSNKIIAFSNLDGDESLDENILLTKILKIWGN